MNQTVSADSDPLDHKLFVCFLNTVITGGAKILKEQGAKRHFEGTQRVKSGYECA